MTTPPHRVMDLAAWKRQARDGAAPTDVVLHKEVIASEIRALDAAARQVRFRITTGAPDRMRDTIDPKGWDLANWRRNPVFLWAHKYDELPIAKGLEIAADAKGLSAVAEFATKEQYPFADTVYQLILGGFLNATSVGFKPKKHVYNELRGGVDFLEQELLEVSVCPIPANPEALVEGKALDLDPLRTWLARCGAEGSIDLDDEELAGLDRRDVIAAVTQIVPALVAAEVARRDVIDLAQIDGGFDPSLPSDRAMLVDAIRTVVPLLLRDAINRARGRID